MKNVFANLNIHLTLTGSTESHPAATAIFVYVYPVAEPEILQQSAPLPDITERWDLPQSSETVPAPAPPDGIVGSTFVAGLQDFQHDPTQEQQVESPAPASGPPSPVSGPPVSEPQGPRGGIRKTCPICGIAIGPASIACKSHYGAVRRAQRSHPEAQPANPPAESSASEEAVPILNRPSPVSGPRSSVVPPASLRLRDRDISADYSDLDLSDLHGSRIA